LIGGGDDIGFRSTADQTTHRFAEAESGQLASFRRNNLTMLRDSAQKAHPPESRIEHRFGVAGGPAVLADTLVDLMTA
jgi:hypothetical protein